MDKTEKIKELFRGMVHNIIETYAADIAAATAIRGSRLSFDELKEKLLSLDKALTEKGASLIDIYKKETGEDTSELFADFKSVIASSMQQFIKTL